MASACVYRSVKIRTMSYRNCRYAATCACAIRRPLPRRSETRTPITRAAVLPTIGTQGRRSRGLPRARAESRSKGVIESTGVASCVTEASYPLYWMRVYPGVGLRGPARGAAPDPGQRAGVLLVRADGAARRASSAPRRDRGGAGAAAPPRPDRARVRPLRERQRRAPLPSRAARRAEGPRLHPAPHRRTHLWRRGTAPRARDLLPERRLDGGRAHPLGDRKSTRLNSR